MTAVQDRQDELPPLTRGRLPRVGPLLVGVVAVAAAVLVVMLLLGGGWVGTLVVAGLLYTIALPAWSAAVEGRRAATDRLVTTLIWGTFVVAMIPLVWVLWVVLKNGVPEITPSFLTYDMRNVIGPGGGLYHALWGTILVTLAAAVISVPLGIFAAIYLVEYGAGSRLARAITFLVDVMTGIPSIVAGLFALALFVLIFGTAIRLGFMGSVALSLLMIPTVVRSSEEMFRLVPNELREASYALGVPKWRTIAKVVLPTSLAGVITGVVLAISRVIGETAPLLVVAGASDTVNFNLFNGRMMTLPVFIFSQYGTSTPEGYGRAWGGALVLIALVMVLNLVARIIGKIFAPASSR